MFNKILVFLKNRFIYPFASFTPTQKVYFGLYIVDDTDLNAYIVDDINRSLYITDDINRSLYIVGTSFDKKMYITDSVSKTLHILDQ